MADQRIGLQCHNWMGIPHEKLYDDIHRGGGTAAVEAAQDCYQRMQVGYAAIFATLRGGLARLAQAHEGAAADASQAAVAVFGDWVDQATVVAGENHSGVNEFSTSYALAKNDMPPPVQVTAVDSAWDDVKDFFGGTTAREAQEQAAHDAHAKAAQVMTTFFDNGAGAANRMPYWTAPQQVAFDVPVPPPSGSGGVAEGAGGTSSVAGGGAGGAAGRVAPMPDVLSPEGTAPAAAVPGPAGGGTPGTPVAPAATAPAGGAGTVVPPGGLAADGTGRGGVPGGGSGIVGGIGAGGAGRTGGGRGVGGLGGAGGVRGASGAGGGNGAAARAASGAVTSNPAATAGRGAAGAAGRPGMGMMPMGAAYGRGSEDAEHRRTVPLDGNLFTDERKVTPPVIGVEPED